MCAYPTVKWNNRSPIAAIWYNGSKNVVSLHTEHVSGKPAPPKYCVRTVPDQAAP